MTPQEQDLILAVAQRLRSTRLTEKDRDAERLIQQEIGTQPDALYLLTQAVIVQEQGLRQAQQRIQQLEADLHTAQQQAGSAAAPPARSFLGGLFGGTAASAPPLPPAAPPPAPPTFPTASPSGGGGMGTFLRTAAGAAAGVVGGQLIMDGLHHFFSGGSVSAGSFGTGPLSGVTAPAAWGGGRPASTAADGPASSQGSDIPDTDHTGAGRDFGSDTNTESGDDLAAEDTGGGGDFGVDDEDTSADDDVDDNDFEDESSDFDTGGGGDF